MQLATAGDSSAATDGPDERASLCRRLESAVSGFAPVSLREIERAALQDRSDTKYVLGLADLWSLLPGLAEEYDVLEIGARRVARYRTIYFDTPDLACYRAHHADRPNRFKVRTREYVDSGDSFVEVKLKVNGATTVKRRQRTSAFLNRLDGDAAAFLGPRISVAPEYLLPALENEFSRITLVNTRYRERLTIDVGLRARGDGGGWLSLDGIVIAESKHERRLQDSAFLRQARRLDLHQFRFSKYCVGVALLYEGVKRNAFKPQLLRLEKLTGGTLHA